jgi:hypothetical protein
MAPDLYVLLDKARYLTDLVSDWLTYSPNSR